MARILLLEDDETMQHLLKTLLEMEGFQVFLQPDSELADVPQAVRTNAPDVILLDVHLRGGSGIDLLSHLKQEKDLSGIRVLMISGMDLREECLHAGADGFLLKPFMPDDLMQQIRG